MKLSYNWIREYLQTDIPPEEMARILTDIGLEVESAETFESIKGGLAGVVTGEVKSCRKHPNADKLSLTLVDTGQDRLLPIVCGAPNVAEGQKVVVALPGAKLYKGEESFEIKKTSIRGETSEGMICAEDELGLGTDHSGIMVLDPDTRPGMAAREYFGIYTDTVFEVGLTPNRIDGGSHFGAARDLAAYFSIRKKTSLRRPDVSPFHPDNHDLPIDVVIEDADACPRYAGVSLSDVKVGPSPAWLQNRLRSIGLAPINNVVDITNFVLHETGQPLHAFDAGHIKGGAVVVRKLPGGTRFVTLDETERILSGDDLMICNREEAMCIGGVFGGLHSGVTEQTSKVFLESAYFDPVTIRRTARRHALNTDASFHFERGADPSITLYALKRAALMIREIAGGKISSDIVDRYPREIPDHHVEINLERASRLIGKKIETTEIITILEALDIKIQEQKGELVKTIVPAYRVDVTREADLVEEILRIYGYNSIEIPEMVHSSLSYAKKPDPEKLRNTVADLLTAGGCSEIMSNSITSKKYYTGSSSFPEKSCVLLFNPLSQDLNAMRQSLLFGGLEAIRHNRNRQINDLKMYEFGHVYTLLQEESQPEQYRQEERLGIWLCGDREPLNWHRPPQEVSFYTLKSIVETVFERMGVTTEDIAEEAPLTDLIEEGISFTYRGKSLGEAGTVSRKYLKQLDIRDRVFYADISWEYLAELFSKQTIRYTPVPRFPWVRRDLALVLDKKITFRQVMETARRTEKKLLRKVGMFDYYEGPQVGKGKKSYAVAFVLQDQEKTLTDKNIDQVMNRLQKAFEKELGARLR